MGQISLQIPQTGQPNTTEDPKVASDLTTIQTVINGNLDDSNLASPNNAVFRLLLQASGAFSTGSANTWIIGDGISVVQAGATTTPFGFPFWTPNAAGEFTVANKTARGQMRVTLLQNSVAPGITFTAGLYPASTIGGAAGGISITLGAVVANSTVAFAAPGASAAAYGHSLTFNLPTVTTPHVIAVAMSGSAAANSYTLISAQLYGFNT